jgi:hypothetical protein
MQTHGASDDISTNEGRSGLSPDFGIDKAALARLCGSGCDISHRRATFEHGFMEHMVAGERTVALGEKKLIGYIKTVGPYHEGQDCDRA